MKSSKSFLIAKKNTNFNEQITSNNKYKRKIFAPNDGFCVYYPSNIFAIHWQNVYKQLTVCCMLPFLLSVLWYDLMNNQACPFYLVNNS